MRLVCRLACVLSLMLALAKDSCLIHLELSAYESLWSSPLYGIKEMSLLTQIDTCVSL